MTGIMQGVSDLYNLFGTIDISPRHCEILSCHDGGSIWMCNDSYDENWSNGPYIGLVVEGLIPHCGGTLSGTACGQAFVGPDPKNGYNPFNIIVRAGC